ncbi:hypothetical protein EMQ25_14785 [Arsenicitalea aurantiaca]|uniref:Methyl-accepting transducer domain-containing protein n=1 Tax=Arsenicitalea aurantiaca TaxID=1783274 RepID=A0A433X5P7_9HYPH|nr:methyl-accepting chemotaxis protein [Arsenicitalea aurantiaca]RUT29382.1 hypothetical protein EMQ25_14785 [Arsenicitalea aurantiaca]
MRDVGLSEVMSGLVERARALVLLPRGAQRERLLGALLINAPWFGALVLMLVVVSILGFSIFSVVFLLILAAAGFFGSQALTRRAERSFETKLAALGRAVTTETGDGARSVEAIVGNLVQRLERASQFKLALGALRHPALVATHDGEILAASQGLVSVLPEAGIEGATLDVLFGAGFLAGGGGMPEEAMVELAGRRFIARRMQAGHRWVIELTPVGEFLPEDDIEAFSRALLAGETSFRFSPEALQAAPRLRRLEDGLASLDRAMTAIDGLISGEGLDEGLAFSERGAFGLARLLAERMQTHQRAVEDATMTQRALESRFDDVDAGLEGYRVAASSLAHLAEACKTSLDNARRAIARGAERGTASLNRQLPIATLAEDASVSVRRTLMAAEGVDKANVDIDKMVSAIEQVSYRTNLLTLNASVEQRREGAEGGPSYAAIAEEARALSQTMTRNATDIRALIVHSRAQSRCGLNEAASLSRQIGALEMQLGNFASDTETIAEALEDAGKAIERLSEEVEALGREANSALALTARRAQDAA